MKKVNGIILITENESFGGLIGKIVDPKTLCSVKLTDDLTNHFYGGGRQYTQKNKSKLLEFLYEDANMFDIEITGVRDNTIEDITIVEPTITINKNENTQEYIGKITDNKGNTLTLNNEDGNIWDGGQIYTDKNKQNIINLLFVDADIFDIDIINIADNTINTSLLEDLENNEIEPFHVCKKNWLIIMKQWHEVYCNTTFTDIDKIEVECYHEQNVKNELLNKNFISEFVLLDYAEMKKEVQAELKKQQDNKNKQSLLSLNNSDINKKYTIEGIKYTFVKYDIIENLLHFREYKKKKQRIIIENDILVKWSEGWNDTIKNELSDVEDKTVEPAITTTEKLNSIGLDKKVSIATTSCTIADTSDLIDILQHKLLKPANINANSFISNSSTLETYSGVILPSGIIYKSLDTKVLKPIGIVLHDNIILLSVENQDQEVLYIPLSLELNQSATNKNHYSIKTFESDDKIILKFNPD